MEVELIRYETCFITMAMIVKIDFHHEHLIDQIEFWSVEKWSCNYFRVGKETLAAES